MQSTSINNAGNMFKIFKLKEIKKIKEKSDRETQSIIDRIDKVEQDYKEESEKQQEKNSKTIKLAGDKINAALDSADKDLVAEGIKQMLSTLDDEQEKEIWQRVADKNLKEAKKE